MKLSPGGARELFARSPVARLATTSGGGVPHIVPVTFAVQEDMIYFAVDHKPKDTWNLRRLRNIHENDQVAVLVDHYADDWSRLWWARADGHAEVWSDGVRRKDPVELLRRKYHQYRENAPEGPVVAIEVGRWSGWKFTG
ncbi:TIGR03668 family PPOX class F420-dependent oxidoreductase [Streptomyces sp. 130]|uniref:TIGR03668 family PPOX class F420-dependent oxidoreductase n=1 Tax=Streptomyces sp. 130 TaxID=2591006 RepID=UPI00118138B5|nr:TIGR03668 family PPOX class F420-dependent oxidoreductase [Streptomyces sp. 130]TRV74641.1 TIGR03668 family PPOX class F420-dependent oxidoreductase [Streptomyces sp. 130]